MRLLWLKFRFVWWHTLKYVIQYDLLLVVAVSYAVTWIVEWFSISQRKLELGLIGLSILVSLVWIYFQFKISIPAASVTVLISALNVSTQFKDTKRVPEMRVWCLLNELGFQIRVFWQLVLLLFFAWFLAFPVGRAFICYALSNLLFSYVVALSKPNQPGRRRKLALAKLKELFGTDWMPKPIGEPS